MCDICRMAMSRWSEEPTEEEFDAMFALAKLVALIPGAHMIGAGVTGRRDAE